MSEKLLSRTMTDLSMSGKSPGTCATYLACIKQLYAYVDKPLSRLTREDIVEFMRYETTERRLSPSSLRLIAVAIRFFCTVTLGRARLVEGLKAQRVTPKPVTVLSVVEADKLISSIESPTHYAVASVLYGTGMRLSEALAITVDDIQADRGVISVPHSKTRQARVARLSVELVSRLRSYWRFRRPQSQLLFHGLDPSKPMDQTGVQHAIRAAAQAAGLRQRVTPHVLRHTHATHLLESGVDLFTVQKLLGHACIESTLCYLNVSTAHLSGKRIELPPLLQPR
jgi:site-specific recombinase XerD